MVVLDASPPLSPTSPPLANRSPRLLVPPSTPLASSAASSRLWRRARGAVEPPTPARDVRAAAHWEEWKTPVRGSGNLFDPDTRRRVHDGKQHIDAHPDWQIRLSLASLSLAEVHESIGTLVILQELNLSRNVLMQLPDSIGRLRHLTHLDVSRNLLTSLPRSIGLLQELETLDASKNMLTSLPSALGTLQALTTLSLSQNSLARLPDAIGLSQRILTPELAFAPPPPPPTRDEKLLKRAGGAFAAATPSSPAPPSGLQGGDGEEPDDGDVGGIEALPSSPRSALAAPEASAASPAATVPPSTIAAPGDWPMGSLHSLTDLDLSHNKLLSLPLSIGRLRTLKTLSKRVARAPRGARARVRVTSHQE